MKTILTTGFGRSRIVIIAVLVIAAAGWSNAASAADTLLYLSGYRWQKPEVRYWINARGGVSMAAVADIEKAITDWNDALQDVPGAPHLSLATRERFADITFDLRVKETRNVFGEQIALQGGYWSLPETTGCVLERQRFSMQGFVLADNKEGGYAETRNLARHLIGHALGLGDLSRSYSEPAQDVMQHMANWGTIPNTDLLISACDIVGLIEIYGPDDCSEIPKFVDFTCQ